MFALVFKMPKSNVHAIFLPTLEQTAREARIAKYNGATFAAVVTGNGKAVEKIREGGLHSIA
jgi:hypothetical protein